MNMSDMNWKSWGLVIVIVLGGSLEVIKRLPKGESLFAGDANPRAKTAKPYSVRPRVGGHGSAPMMLAPPKVQAPPTARPVVIPALTKEQMEKLQAAAPKTTEFDHAGEKAKKKDGKDDEWEIVVDPKTGKRIKRKKKKAVAAKKDEKKEEEVAKTEEPEAEEPEPEDEDIDAAIATAITTGKAPVNNSKKPDDAFASAEEWMRKLLSRPNLTETKRFIDHYNKALVSAEVFYKVVNAMLADSRAQMKQLGVLCLGSTPSVLSFQMLAQVIKSERSGTPPQKDAEGFIEKYKEIARLTLLERILRASTGSFSTVLATKTLEASATKNLTAQAQQQPPPPGGAAAPVRNYTANYQRFVPILTALGKSGDAAIKNQAAITLNTLNGLLQSGGAAVVQPTQASAN